MNVLFLSLFRFDSANDAGIYPDLLREFCKNGHQVYALSPVEVLQNEEEHIIYEPGFTIAKVRTGRIQKVTSVIEKGINTILIERRFKRTIKECFSEVHFDLVLYPTPPITFVNAVRYIKKRDGAKSYLMLKDIFPQNAVDIGILSKHGIKGLIYQYFRRKEKKLYAVSDRIGCMSPANVDYVLKHNPEIPLGKVEVCPNSIEVRDLSLTQEEKLEMRKKYKFPVDKKIFVYGGNLGRPQGISFLIECLKSQMNNTEAFFLIVGGGTEYGRLEEFFNREKPANMALMKSVPKEDYDRMIAACDVGMIFLDHRFTIPNFPSRILSYMQAKLPVLACTDPNTDIGKVIVDGGFGWWCESNDVDGFKKIVNEAANAELSEFGEIGRSVLINDYTVEAGYETIVKSISR